MIHSGNIRWKVNSTSMPRINLGYRLKLEIVDSRSTRGNLLGEASFLSPRTILDADAHLPEPLRTLVRCVMNEQKLEVENSIHPWIFSRDVWFYSY